MQLGPFFELPHRRLASLSAMFTKIEEVPLWLCPEADFVRADHEPKASAAPQMGHNLIKIFLR